MGPAPRLEVAMNIITAFVREHDRERVELVASQLGLAVASSAPAAMPWQTPMASIRRTPDRFRATTLSAGWS